MTREEIVKLRKSGDEVGSFHEALKLIEQLEKENKNLRNYKEAQEIIDRCNKAEEKLEKGLE